MKYQFPLALKLIPVMFLIFFIYPNCKSVNSTPKETLILKELSTLNNFKPPSYSEALSVALSPDGKVLATAVDNVKVWEVATGREIASYEANSHVGLLTFSPNGKILAFNNSEKIEDKDKDKDNDSKVILLEAGTNKEISTFTGFPNQIYSISFSPDGKLVAVAMRGMNKQLNSSESVKLWEVATGKPVAPLDGDREDINQLAFSSDGKLLATGQFIWEVATGRQVASIGDGKLKDISRLAFSPDGKLLVSFGDDLKLWEVATGREIGYIKATGIKSIAFSPDGKLLAIGVKDATVKLWQVATIE